MKYHLVTILYFLLCSFNSFAQSGKKDTTGTWYHPPEMHLSGFVDVFYVYDFNDPASEVRQPFLYNHNRHNEFNLNLGFVKLGIVHAKYRANVAFHAGTYVNDNYAAEPGVLKNILEANAGVSLNKKNNLWVDGGVFASHIGFESAISIDQWTLTRSLLAESSPYFLSGVKFTYQPDSKWELAALVCNGWQRIKRLQGNSMLSFGTQLKADPTENITINWSTLTGTDDPDSTRRMRYFSNLYGQFRLSDKWGLIAGFDMGVQQRSKNSPVYDQWFSPVLIIQYALNNNWKAALRTEYYKDVTGIIIPTGTANGFRTTGLSANIDYSPISNVACRFEGRWLHSADDIFTYKKSFTNNNVFIGTSIAIKFSEKITK